MDVCGRNGHPLCVDIDGRLVLCKSCLERLHGLSYRAELLLPDAKDVPVRTGCLLHNLIGQVQRFPVDDCRGCVADRVAQGFDTSPMKTPIYVDHRIFRPALLGAASQLCIGPRYPYEVDR